MTIIDMILSAAGASLGAQEVQEPVPWYFRIEFLAAVGSTATTAVITYLFTRNQLNQQNRLLSNQLQATKKEERRLHGDLTSAKKQVSQLKKIEMQYENVREKLSKSRVVVEYVQPVLLVGPRHVGKTSLVMQWHAPWNRGAVQSTSSHRSSVVPFYDFERTDTVPHYADNTIMCRQDVHLKLKVHDFPGELTAQKHIVEVAIRETAHLKDETRKNLGVVLVCMLDAVEADIGMRDATEQYFNGDLFANLRMMVSHQDVSIQRLVIVFNKFDLLRKRHPNKSDAVLLKLCVEFFADLLKPLHGACNPERVCETVTVLNRENLLSTQGASIVLGEAARGLVEAVAGTQATANFGVDGASTFLSKYFHAAY